MKLSHRASIAITIGTLLVSGIFALVAVSFGMSAGAFVAERSLPAIMMTADIEAITSGLYALPGDAEVAYSGTRSCSWDDESRQFRCDGGARITEIGSGVSYTEDPAMFATAQTTCVYINILPLSTVVEW